ncbi:MAG TPA: inositol monophosphatase family protein [Candidatus Acidoferrales bacterium]|nr:inositol monophosphatase family protein [Candidatus Acidoferrales bacterium]
MNPLQEYAEFAVAAARAAGEITLRYFQKLPGVEYKADRSPVTVADRESEMLLRARIEERYPSHGILGEEFGIARPGAELRWLLDPIDGTQSFMRGVPLYGVMLGLVARGPQDDAHDDPVVGVVHLAALGETVVAWRGGGCWWNDARARVSEVGRLEDAVLLGTEPSALVDSKRAAYQKLRQRVKLERGWGDCYGYALVATGRADIMMDSALHEWDAAPLVPIMEEAGGKFTDWRGKRTISGGDGFATNGALYDEVMRIVSGGG